MRTGKVCQDFDCWVAKLHKHIPMACIVNKVSGLAMQMPNCEIIIIVHKHGMAQGVDCNCTAQGAC